MVIKGRQSVKKKGNKKPSLNWVEVKIPKSIATWMPSPEFKIPT